MAYPAARDAGRASRVRFLKLLSKVYLVHGYSRHDSTIRTESKQAGEDNGTEQQEESDGELCVLGHGSDVWVAGSGVPDCVERLGRHGASWSDVRE